MRAAVPFAVFAVLALSACSTLREQAGLTKQSPDEFAVMTRAPLIVPPDYNLHPPIPGAAPLNQQDPTGEAQNALFASSDPAVVAANMKGNFSMGERLLLANAGVQRADPSVRAQLQTDGTAMQGADPAFTNRVLAGNLTPSQNQNLQVPKKRKKSVGWFDWF